MYLCFISFIEIFNEVLDHKTSGYSAGHMFCMFTKFVISLALFFSRFMEYSWFLNVEQQENIINGIIRY